MIGKGMEAAALGVADGNTESIRAALMVMVHHGSIWFNVVHYGHHKHFHDDHSTITEGEHGRKTEHPY